MPVPSLQSCWVLHARPYRETSLLVDLLSDQDGLLRGVVRGVRGSSRRAQQWRALVQPFVPLEGSWAGRHALATVRQLEAAGAPCLLAGRALYCGLYGNELLLRVLQPGEPVTGLLPRYGGLLQALAQATEDAALEAALRAFELDLLVMLGLCPDFSSEALGGAPLEREQSYRFLPDSGFVAASGADAVYSGASLLAIGQQDFSEAVTRQAAKRLLRQLLQPLLGERPLASRELFAALPDSPSRS